MEITCTRCHQAVLADNCYCPTCGLPQLQYSAENVPGQAPPERWLEAQVQDASIVDWKRAMRPALALAVPAGMLCSLFSPVSIFGLLWMTVAAAWVVALYLRSQRPAWITIGAGARIGLVTGLLGAWTRRLRFRDQPVRDALLPPGQNARRNPAREGPVDVRLGD
jgi:hypothetical protein